MSTSFERDLARVHRNRWVLAVAALPFVVGAALVVVGVHGLAPMAFLGGGLLLRAVLGKNPWPRIVPARVRVTGYGVVIGAERIRHDDVRAGLVLRDGDGRTLVRLARGPLTPSIDVVVGDDDEGRELLHALELDALQTTATFRAASRLLAHPGSTLAALIAIFLGAALLGGRLGGKASSIALALGGLAVVATVWPARVVVGADGFAITWLFRRRFVAASAIARAFTYEESFGRSRVFGVTVRLRDGEEIRIPISTSRWDRERTTALLARIEAVAGAGPSGSAGALAMLERRPDDEDAAAWVGRLRRIGAGANATTRVAPVAPDALWRIVDDRAVDASVRAAAAVALGPTLDREGRSRLASAARATADERLRVALELAATARDEAEVAAALDEVGPAARRA
ncbi:MAG: hypothetical protein KF819_33050 [Labilithrix sp.]|nr:hypothetical protein [Labilithrix sp.]